MCEIVQLYEAFEYLVGLLFGYAAAGIGDVEVDRIVWLDTVAESDTSLSGELDSIVQEVAYDLRQAVLFSLDNTKGLFSGEG